MTLFGQNVKWTFDEVEQLHSTPCEAKENLTSLPIVKLDFGNLTVDFHPSYYGWFSDGKCFINF